MSSLKITPVPSKSKDKIKEIYNFNVQAFADSQDFEWTEENITNEIQSGWSLYSVKLKKEVICALFVKPEGDSLLTKNTPIKLNYQGNGFSHEIKEFYEKYALDSKLKSVVNYCADDNFRMISLNEGHEYVRTGNMLNNNIIEWKKNL